ncbi:MAG: hypothetical protein Q9183_000740 [Haloplaca sp. 2 TL-2023]
MVTEPENDFSNYLEFDDLQLNFSPFHDNPPNGEEIQDVTGPTMEAHSDSNNNNAGGVMGYQHGGMPQFTDPTAFTDLDPSPHDFPDMTLAPQFFDQQQHHVQMAQPRQYPQSFQPRTVIPPTPNSMEMHGGHAQYHQMAASNHMRAMYDHYRAQGKGQVGQAPHTSSWSSYQPQTTFTPLVSPAVTPHEAQFRYSDFALPAEHFSPLTSPALEAQNHAPQRSVYGAIPGSDAPGATSPFDLNIDPSLQNAVPQPVRKPRRKTSNAAQRNPSRAVRQSPSMKPQTKKKQLSNTSIPPNRVTDILENAEATTRSKVDGQHAVKLPVTLTQDSSEAESVSPEALSEVLMPPPATPKSASSSKSPQIMPGSHSAPILPKDNKPATPASLMRIRKGAAKAAGSALKEQSSLLESQLEQTMEAMAAPEPAKASTKRPALAPLRTADANDDESTPTMSARKTPKIAPISAPASATGSTFPSPSQGAAPSPNGVGPTKRGEPRAGGRGGKKRTSSSSVHVSPALRPRISPSIKPLLPEGAIVSAETSALLLASKSNYQNLVDGTNLPGVSYPETLSTNLTSKRTSHKLAEQGRRNRINTALQEISSLLPPTPNGPTPKDGDMANGKTTSSNGDGNGRPSATQGIMMTGTAAQQSNSKASTVESAIDYIKALQGELRDVKKKLEVAEMKLAGNGNGEAEKTVNGAKETHSVEKATVTNGNANGNDDDG